MNCIVTAGPTFEPLDRARRLTNFSTGRLGSELAQYLTQRGHQVLLLLGQQAVYRREVSPMPIELFSTTSDLRDRLRARAAEATPIHAVFHAAAVSDFSFGKVFSRSEEGSLTEIRSGKYSTRQGTLLAELVPTPKIIRDLREWLPQAYIAGWKYEVDGSREEVIDLALAQIKECRTNACVANGPAYGLGFGLVTAAPEPIHFRDMQLLFEALEKEALANSSPSLP